MVVLGPAPGVFTLVCTLLIVQQALRLIEEHLCALFKLQV